MVQPEPLRVLTGGLDRALREVDPVDLGGAELGRDEGQHAAAATDVDHGVAGLDLDRLGEGLARRGGAEHPGAQQERERARYGPSTRSPEIDCAMASPAGAPRGDPGRLSPKATRQGARTSPRPRDRACRPRPPRRRPPGGAASAAVSMPRCPVRVRADARRAAAQQGHRSMRVAPQQMHVAGPHLGEPLEQLLLAGALAPASRRSPRPRAPRRRCARPGTRGRAASFSSRVIASKSGRCSSVCSPHGSGRPSSSRGRSGFCRSPRARRSCRWLPVAWRRC